MNREEINIISHASAKTLVGVEVSRLLAEPYRRKYLVKHG